MQQGIDQAGSPIRLLWKPNSEAWKPPVVPDEFVGWGPEQGAAYQGVALSDLSHHMRDLFIEGPDATRLLSEVSANNYESFEVGQAKQFVPVTERGWIVQDGILMRDGEDQYTLSGPPASQNWVLYHGERGDYAVSFRDDPDSQFRPGGGPPVLFRYQLQGPRALELVERVFGESLPETKFFHSAPVALGGHRLRALRHGMAGQAGYEFIGDYADGEAVKQAFIEVGEEFGLVQVGALAYSSNGIESGWIPTPTPGIYTDSGLEPYRQWLSLFTLEGQRGLHGTWFSEDIEEYYVSPYELGYGRSISFNHDFIGRDALEQAKENVSRTKVTLEIDPGDARALLGEEPGFFLTYGRYRIEADCGPVGMTFYTAYFAHLDRILALSLVSNEYADPGTELTLVYGEHPGPGSESNGELAFKRMRATVRPAPYNEFARTGYRKD